LGEGDGGGSSVGKLNEVVRSLLVCERVCDRRRERWRTRHTTHDQRANASVRLLAHIS